MPTLFGWDTDHSQGYFLFDIGQIWSAFAIVLSSTPVSDPVIAAPDDRDRDVRQA
jgi:hypothetical protein